MLRDAQGRSPPKKALVPTAPVDQPDLPLVGGIDLADCAENGVGILFGCDPAAEQDDLGKGNLFATGLVAGGALAGVAVALLTAGSEDVARSLNVINMEHSISSILGEGWYQVMGVLFFVTMVLILYRVAIKKDKLQDADTPMAHINLTS